MKRNLIYKPFIIFLIFSSTSTFGQNLIDNGDFENDLDKWMKMTGNNDAMAFYALETSETHGGSQAIRVNTVAIGVNPWDNQFVHKGFYPKKNEEYTLKFWAKTKEGDIEIKAVLQNTIYEEKVYTISPQWQEFSWTFSAQEEYLQLKYFFINKGVIYLDDISITAKNYKPEIVPETDTTTVDIAIKHQIVEGFGSALAFYENWITDHPSKEELYKLAFSDLGLDWLRIRNDYKYTNDYALYSKEFVDKAKQWRGDSIRILMCGWSPPANLKNNDNVNNGTLKKDENGYIYEQYAAYWKEALLAYHKAGIVPDWLSIQNEPDWLTDEWETCKFTPQETDQYPGYDKALEKVIEQFADVANKPKLLGSESLGIGNNQFHIYNQHIKNNPDLFAYAFHLYNGGDPDHPDSYFGALHNIKKDYGNKPSVMTEFEHKISKWFKTSWLINNLMTECDLSAYFYWDLIWPKGGLLDIDNPWSREGWRTEKGFQKTGHYWAFKHFSKFIDAGDQRIGHTCSNSFLRSSAYVSKDKSKIIVVLINPTKTNITTTLFIKDTNVKETHIVQSIEGDFYKEKESLKDNNTLLLPSESVTTIEFSL